MTSTLFRRGPDGFGHWANGPAGLGHRRLSIIDLAGGTQPMPNEDGTIWVTFNGEIYNEPALRKNLLGRGHKFQTLSDTECLVHLYEEHGPEFVEHLNGMFAFALWDIPRQRLVLARDRMGQKPLYWSQLKSGTLIFGSEPKALREHPESECELDRESLARYLFYEYLPYTNSIWKGVQKLRPGHLLVLENQAVTIRQFWQAPVGSKSKASKLTTTETNLPGQFWQKFLVPLSIAIVERMFHWVFFCQAGSTVLLWLRHWWNSKALSESRHSRSVLRNLRLMNPRMPDWWPGILEQSIMSGSFGPTRSSTCSPIFASGLMNHLETPHYCPRIC